MIEAARGLNGSSLSVDYIESMENKRRPDNRRLAVIALVFEEMARTGTLEIPRELNTLRDGIEEIKAGDIRFPFYRPEEEASHAATIRLTHGFKKGGDNTPRKEIDKAIWVRREDQQS